MIRLRHLSLIALALGLAACAESSTAPTVTSTDDDYALVMFGEIGSAQAARPSARAMRER